MYDMMPPQPTQFTPPPPEKKRMSVIQSHIDELKWHIDQLESAEDGFTECPGSACAGCEHKTKCVFFKQI